MLGVRWLTDARSRKTSLGAAILCAMLLGAIGIPVLPHMPKDLSTPFPCQNHPCGCPNADYCWRFCGCQTVAEKLTWAKMHNVRPPDQYLDCASTSGDWEASDKQDQPNKEICRCCCEGGSSADIDSVNQRISTESSSNTSVILISAYRTCRGISGILGIACPIFCEPLPEPWHPEKVDLGAVAISEVGYASIAFPPSPPPPRTADSSYMSEIRGSV